jgi:peptide/nickel transport system ATP-binding protein
MSLLEVGDLTVGFGNRTIVHSVGISLAEGERFGIIGESGSGKTLTALAITGLLPEGASWTGTITLDGSPLPRDETLMARLRGRRIGMVFQEPMTALNPLMRVGAQIDEAMPDGASDTAVDDLLREVGLDDVHARRYPHQLSGGQRQRVVIAIALAGRPDLLIADEPTSALDLITQRTVLDLIADICTRRRMALLFISHDLKAVAALCTRVAVMQHGVVVETGDIATVLQAPKNDYTRRLIAASRFQDRRAGAERVGKTLLEVSSITRDYRQGGIFRWSRPPLRAVHEVSFSIGEAECVALVGPSGCGKSTLARIIVGLDRASSGAMRLAGQTYHGADLPKSLRKDVSLVFQDPFGSFDPRLRIAASLAEPLRLVPGIDRLSIGARLTEAVRAVGLDEAMLERFPHEFSGGQRQRLAIARALVTRPRLLVLDEPVSALDVSVRGEVLDLLAGLRDQFGLTYLIISHDLDMVRAMADRVLVMEAGRIVEEGAPEALFAAPQHMLTRELVAARLPELV